MTYELSGGSDYRPVRRSSNELASPVSRILALRSEALVDRARIAAETASQEFQIQERMDAGFNLATHMTARSAKLRSFIQETGGDPELHQLHSYIKLASTEAIIGLIKGTG